MDQVGGLVIGIYVGREEIAMQERLVKLAPTTVNDTEAQN